MTSKGLRTTPDLEQIATALAGGNVQESIETEAVNDYYPVLIISLDCPFCPSAKNFWSKIADELGVELHVLSVEEHGEEVEKYQISGVPCLVAAPDTLLHGVHHEHGEARKILRAVLLKQGE